MSKQALTLSLVVLAVLAGGLFYLRKGTEGGLGQNDLAEHSEPASSETAALTSDLPEADGARTSDERADAASSITLRGRVVSPEMTPLDEEVWVTANFDEAKIETRVAASGEFELEFPKGTEDCTLSLRGHYLYLEAPVEWELREVEACVLEPELGARIAIDVGFPVEFSSPDAMRSTTVVAKSQTPRPPVTRTAEFNPGGVTYIDALPVNRMWTAVASHAELYDQERRSLILEPGQQLNLRFEFTRGTSFSGRVRFEDGRPASGCVVFARSLSDTGYFALDRAETECDAEGRFAFEGQRPGLYALIAQSEGSVTARLDTERLKDGESRAGLELVLRAGQRIAGRVVWPDGSPAVGAQVLAGTQYWTSGRAQELETDSDGRFEASLLVDGPYRVRASAELEDGEGKHRALLSDIEPGSVDLELLLHAGNFVSGHVVDDVGVTIEQFAVRAQQLGGANASGLASSQEKFTDEMGQFEFSDLPEGSWKLTASAAGHGSSSAERLRLPEDAGAEWELVLPRLASVSGNAVGSTGEPLAGGTVRAAIGYSTKTTVVESDGSYEFKDLPTGTHRLSARNDESTWGGVQEVSLAPGEALTGVDLAAAPGASISGVLHASITEREGRQLSIASVDWSYSAQATADAEGRFAFEGLEANLYRVHLSFSSRGGLNREWAEGYAARAEEMIDLDEGEAREILLGAPREGEVSVEGQLLLGDSPLENQLVYVYLGPEGENIPVTVGYAAEEGRFELRLPKAGDYAFTSAPGAEHAFGRRLDIPSESPHELEIRLGTGSITGTLRGPAGEARPGHTLLLRRAAAIADSRRPGDMQRAKTDGDGQFHFPNLEAGRWELRSGSSVVDQTEGLAIRSDLVVEANKAIEDVELQLRLGAVLSGTCVRADGSPATGARIFVIYADGCQMQPWRGVKADWNGDFQIPAVDAGVVEVYAMFDGIETPRLNVELAESGDGFAELAFE